jgi:hypothetical protein
MAVAERDTAGRFLDLLASTPRGRAIAANMLLSHEAGLCSAPSLREFLVDCGLTSEDAAARGIPLDPVTIVEEVSSGRGICGRRYLRQCRQSPSAAHDALALSNTLRADSFWRFLLGTEYKDPTAGLPEVLPPNPVNSPAGLSEYRTRLAEITADPGWYEPTATVGRPFPFPSNCWITCELLGPDLSAPTYPHDPATEARDQLGLIDYRDGAFLLRLTFPAARLSGMSTSEVARPIFSDLGNSRFQVNQTGSRAAAYAAQGWGATVHLGKFGNGFPDSTGAPERVCTSLPLSELAPLRVDFLGQVRGERGKAKHDDDEAFAVYLEAGRSTGEIRDALLVLFI